MAMALTIALDRPYAGKYLDQSIRACRSRRITRGIQARDAMLKSYMDAGCPVQCDSRRCEHTFDLVDAIYDVHAMEFGHY